MYANAIEVDLDFIFAGNGYHEVTVFLFRMIEAISIVMAASTFPKHLSLLWMSWNWNTLPLNRMSGSTMN